VRRSIIFIVGACTAFAAGLCRGQATQDHPTAASAGSFREEVIAQLTPGSEVLEITACEGHLAWIEKQNGTHSVKLDGTPQGAGYKDVKFLVMCPSQGRVMFFGKRESGWVFVADGKEGSEEYTWTTAPAFQPKGTSLAFGACIEKKKCHLYVDQKEAGPEFELVSYPRYSRDGEHIAYFGKRGKDLTAVVDGKEAGPTVSGFYRFGFSPGGSHFYIAAVRGIMATYVVDGNSGPVFPVIGPIAFSSEDDHYAYGGTSSQSGFKKQKVFGTVVEDGTVVATHEGKGLTGSWSLLAGAQESLAQGVRNLNPDFDGISDPDFDPDGKLVYAVRRDKGEMTVLVGDKAGPGFDDILSPVVFSGDSRHFVYIARHGSDFVEVRDNVAGRTIPAGSRGPTMVPQIMMSKDAEHLAFETVEGGNSFKAGKTTRALRSLVIDGKEGPRYDALAIAMLDADKELTHYFYAVIGAKGNQDLVCVNGQESKLYNDVRGLRFVDHEKSVVFFARDGQRILRVTYQFP